MKATTLLKLESVVRPFIGLFSPHLVISQYSKKRIDFLNKIKEELPNETEIYSPPEELSRTLWGLTFKSPIMNAAGMFKNGECYEMVALQGAGAYLGGTGTWNIRTGNEKNRVYLPFTPYPKSHSASNFLGLPNHGDEVNASKLACIIQDIELNKHPSGRLENTPIGWSVMGSPDLQGEDKLKGLVDGMKLYEKVGVDFLEINESCPNTQHGKPQEDDLYNRLNYIKQYFLNERTGRIPVIVKFSNDTEVEQVPALLDLLFALGYDGVNFGNTSTHYEKRREFIHPSERNLYDHFTKTFGGGVSGRALKDSSLELCSRAVEYVKAGHPAHEFHIIRTGGIETFKDIKESDQAGVSMNQWFTGYFENLARHGHSLYREMFN